ncbi:Cadherin domain protein [Stieleria neptunia]|uniref:Cadherin domain protein n=1 Tax=Stieleria neptunia TaxID=2527979 RepID=A0A518I2B6_9BACT|nr:cadherin-like domain-containing protein [Stieleria neptunia]QDV47196.1 Cadherin domain protein [Stieleria neptunia]
MSAPKKQRVFDFYLLEDRILLSADGFDADDAPANPDLEILDALMTQMLDSGSAATSDDIFGAHPATPTDAEPPVVESSDWVDTPNFDPSRPLEIVFVDAGVENAETLLAGLRDNSDDGTQWSIIHLSSDKDGIAQISQTLGNLSGVNAIHLLSHGNGDGIQLGNTQLDQNSANAYAGQIAAWAGSLDTDADLLIYGCDLASTSEGRYLIEALADLCECDVAASDDATGHHSLGGDWDLEFRVGDVSTDVAFGFASQSSWRATLDIASNLVLHHTFDSDASDSSGNNHDGTLTNGALVDTNSGTNQIGDGKLSLDGSNDYVDFSPHATNFDNLTEGTIAVWVYHDVNDRDVIFEMSDSGDSDSRLALFRDADGSLDFYVREGNTTLVDVHTTPGAIAQNTWTHVAVTVNSGGNKLYINGTEQIGVTYDVGSASTNVFFDDVSQLDFGSWGVDKYDGSNFTRHFNGFLDDGRVYDRALSSTDIAELYNYNGVSSSLSTTTLSAVQDTYIQLGNPSTNEGSDGSLSIDRESTDLQRALVQFNVSSIPVGATITNATLTLQATDVGGLLNIGAYQLLEGWSESSATWNEASLGTPWSIGGATYNSTALDTISTSSIGQHHFDVTALAQDWIDGSAQNYGILVGSPDGGGNRMATYGSREGTVGPVLEITYTAPGVNTITFQQGDTNGYSGTQDTELNEDHPSSSYGNATVLSADQDVNNGNESQALIRFDSIIGTGASQIPDDAYITSASLVVNATSSSASSANISLYEMYGAWDETSTWNSMSNGVSTDGGEAASVAVATLSNPDSTGVKTFTGLESSIQAWVDGASENYGWALINSNSTDGFDLESSEGGTEPLLTVDYLLPGSQLSTVHVLTVDTSNDVLDGDASSIDALLADKGADGLISLREAIWATNNTENSDVSTPDVIQFAIGAGAQTIMVGAGGLPTITDAVVLDASTQGASQLITLDGTNAVNATGGIVLRSNDSIVRGFNVINFPNQGIEIDGSTGFGDGNLIEDNWVGLTAGGAAAGNGDDGILISENADNNIIRNNVVGSSGGDGIEIRNRSAGNWVWGNTVGLSSDGVTVRANTGNGIHLYGSATTNIIGTNSDSSNDAFEGNVISGNLGSGVRVSDVGTVNNIVAGNSIGTDDAGTLDRGNAVAGVSVNNASATEIRNNVISGNDTYGIQITGLSATDSVITGNYIGLNAAGTASILNTDDAIYLSTTGATTIGGVGTGDGNVINAAFGKTGIDISNTSNTTIAGNTIGTNAAGDTRLSGGSFGINAFDAAGTTIGGTTAAASNIVAGYSVTGINLSGNSSGSSVQGNFIGTNSEGLLDLTTGFYGITLQNSAAGILIGGTSGNAGNTIAYNSTNGIRMFASAGDGNSFVRNRIYGNGALGINLQGGSVEDGNGVTENDVNDGDSGPNNYQNFPLITQAEMFGNELTLAGSLDTDGVSTQYRIEFYGNASGAQHATNGEGRYYLGTTTVTTDGSGVAAFSGVVLYGVTLGAGDFVTATATRIDTPGMIGIDDLAAYGSTSEFGINYAITGNQAPVNGVPGSQNVNEDTSLVFSVGNGNAISVSDDGSNPIEVTLTATNGEMTLSTTSGLTFSVGDGANDVTMTFTGTEVDINTALEGMSFVGDPDFNGAADLAITATDITPEIAGNDTVFDTGETPGVHDKEQLATQFSVTTDGRVDSIAAYLYIDKVQDVRFGIYSDVAGEPGTLLVENVASLSPGTGWYQIAFPATALTAGDYWIAWAPGKEAAHFYEATGGTTRFSSYDPSSGFATSWTGTYASNSYNISIYANVTPDAGNGLSDSDNINITVDPVNDEQALATNTGDTVPEGSIGNTVTTAMLESTDVDNTDSQLVYTVDAVPTNGTLYRVGVALNVSDTFTQADVDGGLITYDHDGSETSSDSFDFTVDDGAGTTTSSTFNWTVSAVNTAPVEASIEGGALAYTENAGAVAITSTLALSDSDNTNLESAVVQITGNYTNGQDVLSFVDQNGISGVWNTGSGTMTLTGTATVAQYQAALRSITYTNNSDNPSTATRTVAFTVNDGSLNSNTQTRGISIAAVNDAPTVATNTGTTVLEGATGTAITTAMLNEGDVDDSGAGLTYTITDVTDNGTLYLAGFGALGLNDTFTQADIDAGDVTYDHDGSETASDAFSFSLADGGEDGATPATGTFNFTITAVNDNNPVITSDGGAATAAINVFENSVYVSTVVASDADLPAETLTYSIIGGVDSAKFAIDGSTGVLTFVAAPDFESPTDVGANNVYDVIVQASDGTYTDTQTIAVTVQDTADDGQFLDLFEVDSYSNSDGSEAWSTGWVDSDDGSATTGDIKVSGGDLRINANNVNDNVYRQVDLSGASSASLDLVYKNSLTGARTILLQVSGDGGSNYDTVATIDASTNVGTGTLSIDISAYTAADTRVRFLVTAVGGGGPGGNVEIDSLQVGYTPNSAPTITSNGAGATASVNAAENGTAVTTVTAVDGDVPSQTLTYSIIGGLDSAKFAIDSNSGVLTFVSAPNFESPTDNGGDNVYDVTIQVSDGIDTDTQAIAVTVTDVNESPTVATNTGTTVLEGSTGTAITTAMLNEGDVDDSGAGLTYTITDVTDNGTLYLAGFGALGLNDTFTQADIDAGDVTYDHDGSETASDAFSFSLADGGEDGATPATGTFNITVTAVNDEQVLATNTGDTVPEGSVGNTVTTAMLETTDVDNTDSQLVYTVDAVPTNGTLYRVGVALNVSDTFTQADIDAGLITYDHDGSQTSSDSFDFTVDDGAGTTTSSTFNWTISNVNDAPVEASIEGSTLAYTENDGAVAITSTLALSDVDDTNLESAVVQITGNYANGQDVLTFVDQNGISGVWNAGSGTLTLTGTATMAQYEAALRSITYTNTSDNPSTATRTVAFTVNDGDVDSNTQARDISIAATNDDPTGTGLPSDIAVTEDVSSNVDLSALNLSDLDDNGGNLTVTLSTSTGGDLSASTGGGVTVGGSGTGTLTLTGTLADLNTFLDTPANVQYLHGTPHTFGNDADTIQVVVNDGGNTGSGGGTDQTIGTVNVDITGVNDEQVLSTNAGETVSEGSTGNTVTTAMLETTDIDNTDNQLVYTVDVLPSNGTLYRSGVVLNVSDTFTQADIDAGLITYDHDGSGTTSDSFDFTVDDGAGTTTSSTFNWTVGPVNDAPVEASIEGTTLAYTENDGAVAITSTLALSDVDDTNLESAVVQITGNYANGQDVLTFVDQNGISGVWNAGSGTLTLTGTATIAEYQTALRSITYTNSSDNPSTATRTVAFTVNDGDVDSNTQTRDISIAATNDDPTGAGLPSDITVTEDVSSNVDLSALNLSDLDENGGNLTVTLSTSTGGDLSASTGGGVTVGGSGTGALTLTGTLADLNTFLDTPANVQYQHGTPHTFGNDADTIQVVINDGGNTGSGGGTDQTIGTVNVDITAVNDEQVLATNTGDTVPEGSVGNNVTTAMLETTDVDNTDTQLVYTVDAVPTNGTLYRLGSALNVSDTFTQADIDAGLITYDHDGSQTSSDSFDFTVDDGAGTTTSSTLNWTISNVNDAPVEAAIEGSTLAYTENDGAVAITSTLALSDVDDTNLESAVVQITGNYANGQDVLTFVDQNGISGVWNAGSGTLTLTGTATLAQYEAALRSITYTNTSDNPSTATRTVSFSVNDGDVNSNTQTRDISIAATNDDPTGAGLPSDIAVTEDVSSNVDLSALNLSDLDENGGNLTVTLSTSTGGGLTASTGGGVTVGGSGTGTLTLTGTLADLNTFLDTPANVQYLHGTPHTFGNDADTIQVVINDGGNTGSGGGTDQTIGTVNVDITGVNDSPNLVSNTGMTVAEGSTGTAINSGMLAGSDPDDTSTGLTYTVTDDVDNGTLTLAGFGTLSLGDSFTQTDLDNGDVTYSHDDSETIGDSFGFTLADGGEDGATVVVGTFVITVTPVNDNAISALVDSDPSANTVAEDAASGTIVGITALASDADAGASVTYSLDDDAGGKFSIDSATGVVQVAAALDHESSAVESITVRGTSSDGSTTTMVSSINVSDVNEAPVATGEAFTVSIGETLTVSVAGVIFNDTDVDGDALAIVLVAAPANGTFSLDPGGNFTYTPNASFFGQDSFFYRVTDGALSSNLAEVVLDVPLAGLAISAAEATSTSDPSSDPDSDEPESQGATESQADTPSEADLEFEASNDPSEATITSSEGPGIAPASGLHGSGIKSDGNLDGASGGAGPPGNEGLPEEVLRAERQLYGVYAVSSEASSSALSHSPEMQQLERLLRRDLQQAIVWTQWDDPQEQEDDSPTMVMVGAAGAGMSVFSIGYVFWALRGGALMTVFASSLPAWRFIDPIAMLSAYRSARSGVDEGLDSMLG